MSYGLKWQFSVVWLGQGVGPQEVTSVKVLTVSQATALTGGSAPGLVSITSTGAYPTTGNMSTALSAAATAAGAILNANPALSQWQGFASGGG